MPDSRGSALLRYDANTFMPVQHIPVDKNEISRVVPRYISGQELVTTFPRVSPNRASSYFTMADHFQEDAVNGMSVVPLKSPSATVLPDFYTNSNTYDMQQTNASFIDNWKFRLHNNHSIGVHRFAAMLSQIPALIVGSIASWILFGRGQVETDTDQGLVRTQQEFNAALAGFVTSCVMLIAAVFASQNHNYSHKRAYSQAVLRVFTYTLNFMLSIATIVLCALALINLRHKNELELPPCYPLNCFSKKERIANSGVMFAFSILLSILSFFCVIFGLQAIVQIEKDKKYIRKNSSYKKATYANPIPVTDKY